MSNRSSISPNSIDSRLPTPKASTLIAHDAQDLEPIRQALGNGVLVERLARTFRALGDRTRSRMVLALSMREMCPSDLSQVVGTSLSAISHQLRILRDLEIVRVRRSGRSQLYTLNEHAFGFCAPRLCHAWRQTLDPAGGAEPAQAPTLSRSRRRVP